MTYRANVSSLLMACVLAAMLGLEADPDHTSSPTNAPTGQTTSKPGHNAWNEAKEPADWWNEIKRLHGHVGPWNVLGWRMGKAALREMDAGWGLHELDIICYVPLETPYSCLADGLVVGTGNSIGRLDLRLGEVMTLSAIHVSVRRKDGAGLVLLLRPKPAYLQGICARPAEELETLSRECAKLPEPTLFEFERVEQLNNKASGSKARP